MRNGTTAGYFTSLIALPCMRGNNPRKALQRADLHTGVLCVCCLFVKLSGFVENNLIYVYVFQNNTVYLHRTSIQGYINT